MKRWGHCETRSRIYMHSSITNQNRSIVFKIIEHPSHTGQVINRVDVKGENEYELTYEMDWKFKGEGEDPMDGTVIKGAVIKSVQIIEAA